MNNITKKQIAPSEREPFNYEALTPATRDVVIECTRLIRTHSRLAGESIVKIGQALIEVRVNLGHGHFIEWLEKEFGWSDRTARNFMTAARSFKSETISDLDISAGALYRIAAPSFPEPLRARVVEHARHFGRVTQAGVQAVEAEYQKTGVVPDEKAMREVLAKPKPMVVEVEVTKPPDDAPKTITVSITTPPVLSRAEQEEADEQARKAARENAAVCQMDYVIETLVSPPLPLSRVAQLINHTDAPDTNRIVKALLALEKFTQFCAELKQPGTEG